MYLARGTWDKRRQRISSKRQGSCTLWQGSCILMSTSTAQGKSLHLITAKTDSNKDL